MIWSWNRLSWRQFGRELVYPTLVICEKSDSDTPEPNSWPKRQKTKIWIAHEMDCRGTNLGENWCILYSLKRRIRLWHSRGPILRKNDQKLAKQELLMKWVAVAPIWLKICVCCSVFREESEYDTPGAQFWEKTTKKWKNVLMSKHQSEMIPQGG